MPSGIHHVTSIASSARRNLDFYTGTLGLRLVKKTVNFDDPGSYHLYYGDGAGHPGTILTFFPWEGAPPGRLGIGEAQETVFRVPEGSVGYWTQRLIEKGVDHDPPAKRFGETTLAFKDLQGIVPYPATNDLVSVAGTPYTGVVVEYDGDGVYDPHAIAYQLDSVKYQYGCFFKSFLDKGKATVPAPAAYGVPCLE